MSNYVLFRCSHCKKWRSGCAFGKNRHTKNGLQNQCRECRAEWRGANADHVRQYDRDRYATERAVRAERARKLRATPGHQAKEKARARAYYLKNRERVIAKAAAYAATCPDRMREWKRQSKKRNPLARKAQHQAYRMRLKAAPGDGVSAQQWGEILEQHACRCAYCLRQLGEGEVTMDHVIPLSRGGWHDVSNVVPACNECNSGKRDRGPVDWMLARLRSAQPADAAA